MAASFKKVGVGVGVGAGEPYSNGSAHCLQAVMNINLVMASIQEVPPEF